MAPKKRTKPKEMSLENLLLEDVFCIACRCIYVRPVTMPCGHTLCLECFKSMVSITAYQCPTCRMRISNWLRKFKNDYDSMVNEKLWVAVQQQYPVEVQKRLNDEDDTIEERIVCQGFTRVQNEQGEVKKEFDYMLMNFQQEQEKIESLHLELAKKYQEEEAIYEQSRKALIEKTTSEDENLVHQCFSMSEQEAQKTFQQEQSDLHLALLLQKEETADNQIKRSVGLVKKSVTISSKENLPTKGPLDRMFAKLSPENTKTKGTDSWSNYSSSSSNSFQTPSTSSRFSTDLRFSSSATELSDTSVDENVDTCTCGRLLDNFNSEIPPCQFCNVQIALLNKLTTQQKNDLLMAKNLQKEFQMENFEDYNLRKRSANSIGGFCTPKKMRKLPKGQQTLEKMFVLNQ